MFETLAEALAALAEATGETIQDVIDYCTGNDSKVSCDTRYKDDMKFCVKQYSRILYVLGEDEAHNYYNACAIIAGDRLSNCKRGILDTPKMPEPLF